MASFTDQIPSFNPYIQQLPVEAMVQVGTTKQAQYDQGYQKIQSNIDQIAGMDVIRDVDKSYLQSKLNTLKGDLRKVAAGDFSNYQLVNSVGGMVTKISRDKNIQNAVGSSARYRKGLAEMETAKKEGKSSPSNEYVFNRRAAEWLNSDDINSTFDGSYQPYTNWKKNGLEVLKSLTKDSSITDDAFTVDSRGNIVIADAVVRKKLAGISPEKIQQALLVGLTPSDFQQMEIDGIYNYANLGPEQFYRGVQDANSSTLGFYKNQRTILENAKSSTTSVPEKQKLNEQIAALDRTINQVSSQYDDILSAIRNGDLDGAKARYFTRNSIDGFSKAFAYTETSQTYENSPFAEAERWRQGQAQDWKKFLLNYEQREKEIGLKAKEVSNKQKENELAEGYGGLPMGIDQADLPKYTLDRVVQETKQNALTVEALDYNFMQQQGKDQNWLNQQKAAWERSPSSVAEHLNLTERIRRQTQADIAMINQIENEAINKFGTIENLIPKDAVPFEYNDGNVAYTYNPSDFVNFNETIDNYRSFQGTGGTGGGGGSIVYNMEAAKRDLSPKEMNLLEALRSKNPTAEQKAIVRELQSFNSKVNIPNQALTRERNNYTAEKVAERLTVRQGVAYGLPTGNAEQKSTIATALTQFADLAESQKGGLANSPNFDSELARKLATEDAKYSLTVVEGSQIQPRMYKVSVSGKSGNMDFRITPEQKMSIFGDRFDSSPKVQAAQPYLEQMRKMGGYSTAYTPGPSTPQNSFLGKIDFPSVNLYGIKANVVTLSPNSNRYTIKLNIYDPVSKTWHTDIDYPKSGMIPAESITDALRLLNDSAVYELLNEGPATAGDLKNVEIASKKPL
jgi:hypothetical protein